MKLLWLAAPSSTGVLSLSALALVALFPGGSQQKNSSGKLPVCDAGAPQVVECTGPVTAVQLDGTGSFNPVKGELTYKWEPCVDPKVSIDDDTSATPMLLVELQDSCSLTCEVHLAVHNQFGNSSCATVITVQDTTPPTITCPPDIVIQEGDPTDPSFTGTATATDLRDPDPRITYVDDLSQGPDTILRIWTADDGCQASSCTQVITIEPEVVFVHFDLLPKSCPNLFDVGAANLALAGFSTSLLGNDFDVTQIDLPNVTLSRVSFFTDVGVDPVFGNDPEFGDTSTPFEGPLCGCNKLGPDGLLDLVVHFDAAEVIDAFDLDEEPNGTVVVLQIDGRLLDGTPFVGQDCITIVNR